MADIPCLTTIVCPGSDSPIANVSAETSDGPNFKALQFPSTDPSLNPNPLAQGFVATGCLSTCESDISQQDADLCAMQQAFLCQHTNPVTGQFFGTLFASGPESATIKCPDGTPFTFTVPAGAFFALNQAQANAQAKGYAQQQAGAHIICLSALSTTNAVALVPYTGNLTATGNLSPFPFSDEWEVTGDLPPGLDLDEAFVNGGQNSITGTPTTPGTYAFSVTVTNGAGDSITKGFTIVVSGNVSVTPTIFGPTVSFFNSGANFAAGTYQVNYVNGAFKLAPNFGYSVWDYMVDYGATTVNFPSKAGSAQFDTQALCEAANAGSQIVFHHAGGPIGVWLSDSNYGDNQPGAPNPTFNLVTISVP